MASDKNWLYSRYLQSFVAAKMTDGKAGAGQVEEVDIHVAVAIGVRDAKAGSPILTKTEVARQVDDLLK